MSNSRPSIYLIFDHFNLDYINEDYTFAICLNLQKQNNINLIFKNVNQFDKFFIHSFLNIFNYSFML